jgi:hypothetical protein
VPISAAKIQNFADTGKKRDNFFPKNLYVHRVTGLAKPASALVVPAYSPTLGFVAG